MSSLCWIRIKIRRPTGWTGIGDYKELEKVLRSLSIAAEPKETQQPSSSEALYRR